MSIMLPDDLVWVLNLLGFMWPEADEDKLREAAQHWREFAAEVGHVTQDANRVAATVAGENRGSSIDAFHQHWQGVGGSSGSLAQTQQAAEIVADVLDGYAAVVVIAKGIVIAQLIALAAELTATTVGAIFTFGAAEAAAPEEIGLTQIVVRDALHEVETHVEEEVAQKLGQEAKTIFEDVAKQEGAQIEKAVAHDLEKTAADKSLAVIGRFEDTKVARSWPGHEVLNLPDGTWSLAKNDEWVGSVIQRKMGVYIASNMTWENIWNAARSEPRVFWREYQQFMAAGYSWGEGWNLLPPGVP